MKLVLHLRNGIALEYLGLVGREGAQELRALAESFNGEQAKVHRRKPKANSEFTLPSEEHVYGIEVDRWVEGDQQLLMGDAVEAKELLLWLRQNAASALTPKGADTDADIVVRVKMDHVVTVMYYVDFDESEADPKKLADLRKILDRFAAIHGPRRP